MTILRSFKNIKLKIKKEGGSLTTRTNKFGHKRVVYYNKKNPRLNCRSR